MPLQVRFSASFAAILALGVCAGVSLRAQSSSSSSQSQPTPTPASQSPDNQAQSYGTYSPLDPLARVRYDNRFDVSLGMAYDHMKAGANVLQGANLGGLDLEGSFWFSKHWGVEGSGRYYVGTSGVGQPILLKGPFVDEFFVTGGPEWLGPHNKHGALIAHAMFGGAHFNSHTYPYTAAQTNFYQDQFAPAGIIGGHFDLNRSDRWVFRVTPDAVMTHYNFSDAPYSSTSYSQFDVNFAISVGVEYKFTRIKRSTKNANWASGW
jgi:hypothetical protein